MPSGPAHPDPGRDEDPARRVPGPDDFPAVGSDRWRLLPSGTDWMDNAELREAYLASLAGEQEPDDPDLDEDPDNAPPPGLDDAQLAELIAGAREVTAARFAAGTLLDGGPGCTALMGFADDQAGEDDRYTGSSDDELLGAISAWDRVEAHAAARKHAAVAELIRRHPEPGCAPGGEAPMPGVWDEFTTDELAAALAESRFGADRLLDLARDLEVRLPGTKAAFRAGVLRQHKVEIIARATEALDADQARAAETLVLGRAGRLTPGGLRAAIARAVMEIAPDKARKRREEAARKARVERWAEDSGNAALAGRELPPAEVLAADQRITWWANQLRKAGLAGSMDELRARAYLDILLDMDSRPEKPAAHRTRPADAGPGGGPGGPEGAGPGGGVIPPGFAGRVTVTVPLTTLTGLADRPGEIGGIGPIDPPLARDLASAAARNPRSTWCVTVTDQDGHAIGHGCARPAGRGGTGNRDGPPATGQSGDRAAGFAFTGDDEPGPPGGYGAWRLSAGAPGRPGLLVRLEPVAAEGCDHRFAAAGHDPGVMLRHLTQVRHATCTGPTCRRPASQCDFEHNTPYEMGGRTCLCNGDPKCRHDHRVKQDPRWQAERLADGSVRWTTPAGRQYTTEPTRYPI